MFVIYFTNKVYHNSSNTTPWITRNNGNDVFDTFAGSLITTPFNMIPFRVESIFLTLSMISDTSLVYIKTAVSNVFEGILDITIGMDGGAREV